MSKKRILVVTLVLVMVFLLAACGSQGKESAGTVTPEAPEAKGIEITDQLGRKVTVPAKVERIVSSNYIDTTLLMALGATERMVGIEIKGDTRPLYKLAAPRFLEIPGIGSGKTFNVEECLMLEPDLVVLPTRLKDFIGPLEQQNIAVIALEPENLQSMEEAIDILAKAIGAEERGRELKGYFNGKIEFAKDIAARDRIKPRVIYIAGSNPLTTCTEEMFQHTQVTLAGGLNAAGEIKQGYWTNVSLEQLLQWDPDEIVLVQYAPYQVEDILQDVKWQGIRAVKNKKVYRFPSLIESWDMPTPSSILGILWFTHHLHPGEYPESEFANDVTEFYEKFYGVKIPFEEFGI